MARYPSRLSTISCFLHLSFFISLNLVELVEGPQATTEHLHAPFAEFLLALLEFADSSEASYGCLEGGVSLELEALLF